MQEQQQQEQKQQDAASAAAATLTASTKSATKAEANRRKLDYFYNLVDKTVLRHQSPTTGLVPSVHSSDHAYIRDNTYAMMCTWGLMLAYRKVAEADEDRAKIKDLEGRVVKAMRSLLVCMMRQSDRVERFKRTRLPSDALHCKFSCTTLNPVTADDGYGHLQLDAVSLYLLMIAQMTASGLVLIYTPEEVAFVQNLVFYIDSAYMVCDYGIWERGDKTNHGLPELNSTSIGMAKAALEALSELDLFGSSGGSRSFIHVMGDDSQNCAAVLENMLPRESCSKETDAGLLSVISYPAFAVDNEDLVNSTRDHIVCLLEGSYGCCRFLRDGYRTAIEDSTRLHYEPWELKMFENIECEWPLFYCYLLLDSLFSDDKARIDRYSKLIDKVVVFDDDGLPLMPESYSVPWHLVQQERDQPRSQQRISVGRTPHLWSQSMYIICQLVKHNLLRPQELDPIGRRLALEPKPDLVVQVVIVAEDESLRRTLAADYNLGEQVQDFEDIYQETGIRVFPARILGHFYRHLGHCSTLGLTGRQAADTGILATSRLYVVGSRTVAFTPQFLDHHSFYLSLDIEFLLDRFRTDVAYLRRAWTAVGRPLFIIPVYRWYFADSDGRLHNPALHTTIKKLQSGYINGTRVTLGNLNDFVDTSCVTNMTFLDSQTGDDLVARAKATSAARKSRSRLGSLAASDAAKARQISNNVRRRKSMAISSAVSLELGEQRLRSDSYTKASVGQQHEEADDAHRCTRQGRRRSSGFASLGIVPNLNEMINEARHPHEDEAVTHKLRQSTVDEDNSKESMKRLLNRASHLERSDSAPQIADLSDEELLIRLERSEHLYEQFDLLYHLYITRTLDYDTGWTDSHSGSCVTVRELVKEVYERAGQMKQWWLVRYTAGMLQKRVDQLPMFITDLLVRQKQVTVGLPPEPKFAVITSPQAASTLAQVIMRACSNDITLAVLTQELLVYLSMLARTEPQLFDNMYRIRVGLIIRVMGTEMGRSLNINAEEATQHLLSLSPFEMKTLLHNILSGKEFHAEYSTDQKISLETDNKVLDFRPVSDGQDAESRLKQAMSSDRRGQWLRRRKIDGALNRVPSGFYKRMWLLLDRTQGLSVCGQVIGQHLTKEMTAGEVKFALQVEAIITAVPVPEYRQLIVEALSLLVRLPELDGSRQLDLQCCVVPVEQLVHRANQIFLNEQLSVGGDACSCCAKSGQQQQQQPQQLVCSGACGVCHYFYDTAPSGRYGTLTYLLRALPHVIKLPVDDLGCVPSDCSVQ